MKKGPDDMWVYLDFSTKSVTPRTDGFRMVRGFALMDCKGNIRSPFSKYWPDSIARVFRHDKLIGYADQGRVVLYIMHL